MQLYISVLMARNSSTKLIRTSIQYKDVTDEVTLMPKTYLIQSLNFFIEGLCEFNIKGFQTFFSFTTINTIEILHKKRDAVICVHIMIEGHYVQLSTITRETIYSSNWSPPTQPQFFTLALLHTCKPQSAHYMFREFQHFCVCSTIKSSVSIVYRDNSISQVRSRHKHQSPTNWVCNQQGSYHPMKGTPTW